MRTPLFAFFLVLSTVVRLSSEHIAHHLQPKLDIVFPVLLTVTHLTMLHVFSVLLTATHPTQLHVFPVLLTGTHAPDSAARVSTSILLTGTHLTVLHVLPVLLTGARGRDAVSRLVQRLTHHHEAAFLRSMLALNDAAHVELLLSTMQ